MFNSFFKSQLFAFLIVLYTSKISSLLKFRTIKSKQEVGIISTFRNFLIPITSFLNFYPLSKKHFIHDESLYAYCMPIFLVFMWKLVLFVKWREYA